ncbi:Alcohol dehydrogenase zinc-binding domain protein [Methylobacterium sp. 4-46]|uniref:NAD(P)-binding protein n=1 Tax=unclassified Methylobacterium TaxID=2615210 RepID=UPI000165CCE5|nr:MULTISPECIES: NAD(P)-binding protein [Methylobacterium]ACA19113.1 Alcohol dehydrogenase zinc-binding domain protein [Methylobacterium sp. 4-46]WFT78324.1 dehydrogenase [Methylobacterium nodulans]
MWTALSRGTERLVYEGRVPERVRARMRAPAQEGDFPFPVKYGYCAVGRVMPDGPVVFALQPHQEAFASRPESLVPLPPDLPPRRALLAANMETALNGLWDSGAGPGDRVAVVGGGLVGLLAAHLAAGLPGAEVTLIDRDPARAGLARHLGLPFRLPAEAPGEADVVIHASAAAEGLALALDLAGEEACVTELSWYGDGEVAVPLGAAFHPRRLRLVSSQVGQVPPARRPRWDRRRRLLKALDLLRDPRLDALITEEVAFEALPAALPRLLARDAPGVCTAIRYQPAEIA